MQAVSRQMFGSDNFSAEIVIANYLHKVTLRHQWRHKTEIRAGTEIHELLECVITAPVTEISAQGIHRRELQVLDHQLMPFLSTLKIDTAVIFNTSNPHHQSLDLQQVLQTHADTLQHVELDQVFAWDHVEFLAGMSILVNLPKLNKLMMPRCSVMTNGHCGRNFQVTYDRDVADRFEYSGSGSDLVLGAQIASLFSAANAAKQREP